MVVPESVDRECALAFHLPCLSKTHFRLGVAAIFAVILLNNLTSPNRYTSIVSDTGRVTVTDGVTGKVWRGVVGGSWVEIVEARGVAK